MTLDKESSFTFEELFFSRTDPKGIILSGNSVFKRVSGYGWDELIQRPHNLVRHPDMPKGVFFLFWKTIKSGNPIGAYVKNRSKDGAYYWVFALALPIDNGILSIRLKPSSPFFEVVKSEYQKLLKAEKAEKLSPEKSCEILVQTLQGLGFANYESFMVKALMEELTARQSKLGRSPIDTLIKVQEILTKGEQLLKKSNEISTAFRTSTLLPLNLTIKAAKLDRAGEPLAIVAEKYAEMTKEIQDEFSQFINSVTLVQGAVANCQYSLCAQALQTEVLRFFEGETDPGPNDIAFEMSILNKIRAQGGIQSVESLKGVMTEFDRLLNTCERFRTVTTGLEIVRLMGKLEVARLDKHREELGHLIEELLKFKSYLVKSIQEIVDSSNEIKFVTGEMVKSLSALESKFKEASQS